MWTGYDVSMPLSRYVRPTLNYAEQEARTHNNIHEQKYHMQRNLHTYHNQASHLLCYRKSGGTKQEIKQKNKIK